MPRPLRRVHWLRYHLPDEWVNGLEGTFLDGRHYDTVLGGEAVDCLKLDGTPLFLLRPGAIPAEIAEAAWPALLRAARPTQNRGTAAGTGWSRRTKEDGTLSPRRSAPPVLSGLMGYQDPHGQDRYCRTTAYTRDDVAGWVDVLPLIRAADEVFLRSCPRRHAAQLAAARATDPYWRIGDTAFTTVTVNRNFRTAAHRDKGDYRDGFGVMAYLRRGSFTGGYLVFPRYDVAVRLADRDVLLADVHEVHGNTELVGTPGAYERISCVFYYRTRMRRCGTAAEELERAKRPPLQRPAARRRLARRESRNSG